MIEDLDNAAVRQVLNAELWRCVELLRGYPRPIRPQDRPDLKLRPGLIHASARLAKLLLFATRHPRTALPGDWEQGEGGGTVSTIFEVRMPRGNGEQRGAPLQISEVRIPDTAPNPNILCPSSSCVRHRVPARASEADNLETGTGCKAGDGPTRRGRGPEPRGTGGRRRACSCAGSGGWAP